MKHTDLSACRETIEMLPWHAAGSLEAAERKRVDEHLAQCAACRREREFLESLIEALPHPRAVHDHAPPFSRLLQRINRHERRTRAWKIAAALAAVLAVVIAIALPLRGTEPQYRAVTDPVAVQERVQLEVMLQEPDNTAMLTSLLEQYDADIVSAPPGGPVRLEFRVAGTKSVSKLLAELRAEPKVRSVRHGGD